MTISTSTNTTIGTKKLNLQNDSRSIAKFIKSVSVRNKNTAKQYQTRLLFFERFVLKEFNNNSNVDKLIQQLKNGEFDPYDILNDFCLFLQNNYNISSITFRDKITTVKTFLEFNDIEISLRKFKLKVRYPKTVFKHKEAIDKDDIIKILNVCSNLRLKTYVMFLASTGCRATEALSILNKNLDLESNPAKVTIRGEYTKTKVDRYVFLTKEVVEQLKIWLDFKYRTRRICRKDQNGKNITEYRTPKENNLNGLVFSHYQTGNSKPDVLYENLGILFAKTLDRIGMGSREDGNENRRKITLHSFRRFVKTTISDLGFQEYSEWFLGHARSTYWRKKDSEKAELFKKIEPYLTFLDIQQLERKGADMETQIRELQEVNQILRDREQIREERDRKSIERLSKLEEKFEQLTAKLDIERQQSRDYENTSFNDLESKNKKFEKYLKTQRERIKQESNLINSIKEPQK